VDFEKENMSNEHAEWLNRVGMVVRITRNVKGVTLQSLADASGVSKGNLSKIEAHGANITLESLAKIAAALGTTPQQILDAAK
jgi:transcriptional regulator with XRE-family HTH domain